jgi:hypothetical protein
MTTHEDLQAEEIARLRAELERVRRRGPSDRWAELGPPASLRYVSLDGEVLHELGHPDWTAATASADPGGQVLDLMNIRAQLLRCLRKIEDVLDTLGLLGRVTHPGGES